MATEPRIKIYYNKNLEMTPGRLAAQAVHSALMLMGVHPGTPVVVLAANKGRVQAQEAVAVDEGRTEIAPGSTTAGASFEFPVEGSELDRLRKRYEFASQALGDAMVAQEKALRAYLDYDED